MNVNLHLEHGTAQVNEPTAWFLESASVAFWVEEMARSGLADSDARLYLVPGANRHGAPVGVLVIPGHGKRPSKPPLGLPCKTIAGKLVIPANATLHPPAQEAELKAILTWPVQFFHPIHGWSGFDEQSEWSVMDLLAAPPVKTSLWNFAQPPTAKSADFQGIQMVLPPTILDLFGSAQEEIGHEPPQDLPPLPNEPQSESWHLLSQKLRGWMARRLLDLTKDVPKTATQKTWVNNLEDWAGKQIHGTQKALDQVRNKELHRLLQLFDQDPDQALKHAIPFNNFGPRGKAPPGGKLGQRTTDFSLQNLGGKPGDAWDVPEDIQQQLQNEYRKRAALEMQMKRYRRAAYIYAHLLGDLSSAANALKTGGHYREAAVLFEDHLNNPLQAAQCLAEGGWLFDAVMRYEKLQLWKEAAELHDKLGNKEAAVVAHRKLVESYLKRGDRLLAAQWLEEKLQAPEESIQVLQEGWPDSPQAYPCLHRLFEMLGQRGEHAESKKWLSNVVGNEARLPAGKHSQLIEILSHLSQTYPDKSVRHVASDRCIRMISQLLLVELPLSDTVREAFRHLERLQPHDPILKRDTGRYLRGLRERVSKASATKPPPLPSTLPEVVGRIELPRQITWLRIIGHSRYFFAVGTSPMRLTMIRGLWAGEQQSLSWECASSSVKSSLLFEMTHQDGSEVMIKSTNAGPFQQKFFPSLGQRFGVRCSAGSPPWLNPSHWPVAVGDETIWTAHLAAGSAILSSHSKQGQLLQTLDVTGPLLLGAERSEQTRLCLAVIGNRAVLGLGNRVVITRSSGEAFPLDLPGQLIGLFPTLPHTRAGIVALMTSGAAVHWLGTPGWLELDRDIKALSGAFIPGGPLVLIGEHQILMFEVDSRGVGRTRRTEAPNRKLVGVCGTGETGHFATLSENGELTRYRVQNESD